MRWEGRKDEVQVRWRVRWRVRWEGRKDEGEVGG